MLFRYLYAWFSKYKFFFIGITINVIRACTFLKTIYFIWLCLRNLIHEKYENLVFEGSRNFLSVSWGCNSFTVYIWYGFLQQHIGHDHMVESYHLVLKPHWCSCRWGSPRGDWRWWCRRTGSGKELFSPFQSRLGNRSRRVQKIYRLKVSICAMSGFVLPWTEVD